MTLSSITSTHAVPRTPRLHPRPGSSGGHTPAAGSKSLQRVIVVAAAGAAVAILGVATLVGGTIVIPHLRRAFEFWEELQHV